MFTSQLALTEKDVDDFIMKTNDMSIENLVLEHTTNNSMAGEKYVSKNITMESVLKFVSL